MVRQAFILADTSTETVTMVTLVALKCSAASILQATNPKATQTLDPKMDEPAPS
jgi:hypothetical protein